MNTDKEHKKLSCRFTVINFDTLCFMGVSPIQHKHQSFKGYHSIQKGLDFDTKIGLFFIVVIDIEQSQTKSQPNR